MTLHRSQSSSTQARISDESPRSKPGPNRGSASRDRQRRRLKNRRGLLETLENRQLLAGPDLIGVQPNVGSLLFESPVQNVDPDGQLTVLQQSPQELVFRFDDDTQLDPDTLSGIRITRAGEDKVFDSATATSDLGTNGDVVLEFRARQSGATGNGIQVVITADSLVTSQPQVSVSDRTVAITVSNTPGRLSNAQDVILAVANNPLANDLVEVIQVSGSTLGVVGDDVSGTTTLTLEGANAAEAVTDLGTSGSVLVRMISQVPGEDGLGVEVNVTKRDFGGAANPVVLVSNGQINVQLNSNFGNETTADEFVAALNNNPNSAALVKTLLISGNGDTLVGNRNTLYSPLTLSGASDVVVQPGYVGLGDSPREVVFRFAEPLPDDTYQIDIVGVGPTALTNIAGEPFQDGVNLSRQFQINLGPQVVAVVPEPVRRNASTGALQPQTGKIEVHFGNDTLSAATASNPAHYQLIFTSDTANNTDDSAPINPTSVQFDPINNIALLDFSFPLSRIPNPAGGFYDSAARLRIGTSEGLPAAPAEFDLQGAEPGDSLSTATDLGTLGGGGTQSTVVQSTIENESPYGITLPGPDLPGTRTIRPEDPSRLTRTVPLDYVRNDADSEDGIAVMQYAFPASFSGPNPNGPGQQTYFNVISEQQKDRVREAIQLYSEYLGISFIEVEGAPTSPASISIAVGDLFASGDGATSGEGGLAAVTADSNADGIDDLGILDLQDFDDSIDDQFGDEFFRGAMFIVGQLLGYGYADDLPQPTTQSTSFIFNPGSDNEPSYPSTADIVHGQYLYRPESTDVDLFEFTLSEAGTLTAETIAERLGSPSLLDSALRLYRVTKDGSGNIVSYEEVAANDDYFSNDAMLQIDLAAGDYAVGVSAKGNTSYDPGIGGTGFGGRTEGDYELRLDFVPRAAATITDATGVALDGDADGQPGGVFNFWFVPADADKTVYVDKLGPQNPTGILGSVSNPYRNIDDAIAAATQRPGTTIRVVGNGGIDGDVATMQDNFSYQIGYDSNGFELADGATLNLPKSTRLIIDSGAILKLSRARIGVGSVSPTIDASDAAIQVLGTPSIIGANGLPVRDSVGEIIPGNVIFTSINDDTVGSGNTSAFTPDARPGDWGGIDLRGDLDSADESRRNRENEGVFLNHIQYADMRYGGGAVSIAGQQVAVSPIDMAVTRATVANSVISNSADAAIAATPSTFTETRFTDNIFQGGGAFTPDYTRVGPDIHGNIVVNNSFNGLFVRVRTRTGDRLEPLTSAARFDDTDITHVLTENLIVQGTPGGPLLVSSSPSSLLVQSAFTDQGDIAEGNYTYRITYVTAEGLESAASDFTVPFELTGTSDGFGGIQLSGLPTIGSNTDFVSRRLYRAEIPAGVDPSTLQADDFLLVAQLNASSTSFVDRNGSPAGPLSSLGASLQSRLDASLKIDPGTVIKLEGSRIEARFGADIYAEGTDGLPVVFTGLEDTRYGAGGTFDTNDQGTSASLNPGDWGGLYIGQGATASIDHAVIAGAGGLTRIEGGFAEFNALEVHQANLRLANSRFEMNASGDSDDSGTRVGRGENAAGNLFVRASQPVIVDNEFFDGGGAAITFDVNSLGEKEINDPGRSTGAIDRVEVTGNQGPLIRGNTMSGNDINGLQVRGGELTTAGVWDDTDIVHVVTDTIEIPNQHIFGGLRLQSDANSSLVVKFADGDEPAAIVVGGTIETGSDELVDIADRIGGSLQIVGSPDFPVVLTSLFDNTVGAGFDSQGNPLLETTTVTPAANTTAGPGDWTGIIIREAAHDRNVALVNETESNDSPKINSNAIPGQSSFLGELAPDEQSGDENRRLGFVVSGEISTTDDVDVYSFVAESNTEVWLDIDRTSNSLDSVVELIDANGRVLAASNDSSIAGAAGGLFIADGLNQGSAQPLTVLGGDGQDAYSTNAKDAGMRLTLPGEAGTRNLYHVRVRSSNTDNPTDFATLTDPGQVLGGLTSGSYQLQVRLQETDETPGTQINFADVRYADNGVQIIGQPMHSPLLGEESETDASNDVRADAQPLGYYGAGNDGAADAGPLQSDLLAKSFSGSLDSATDVDWYQFTINYESLTRDGAAMYLSTVFDLDYADNFARADMALYVFNEAGQLILIGGDSNIADDLPASSGSNGSTDLSRGSAGTNDPFIGAAELSEGTYYVAVANQQQVPQPLDQFFNANSTNPLLRLEPIDSVRRIAEDRIAPFGNTDWVYGGTADDPVVPLLFDADSVVDYTLDDVVLYVNTSSGLHIVNPYTGDSYGLLGNFGETVRDIAFTANGELFGYSGFVGQASDTTWFYNRIDTTDGSLSAPLSTGGNIQTFHDDPDPVTGNPPVDNEITLEDSSDVGFEVEAISIRARGGEETGFFVGNRASRAGLDYFENVLFRFNPEDGTVDSQPSPLLEAQAGAGASLFEVGQINTAATTPIDTELGLQEPLTLNSQGILVPQVFDGDSFTLSNGTDTLKFELDSGYALAANPSIAIADGDTVLIDGTTFEFNTGVAIQLDSPGLGGLTQGSTLMVEDASGQIVTIEFTGGGVAQPGNVAVSIVDGTRTRTAGELAAEVSGILGTQLSGLSPRSMGDQIIFTSASPVAVSTTGSGVNLSGDPTLSNAGAVEVFIAPGTRTDDAMKALAEAIRNVGVAAVQSGTLVSLPNSTSLSIVSGSSVGIAGTPGVSAGSVAIPLYASDSLDSLAARIVAAIDNAEAGGSLANVTAVARVNSIQIGGQGFITDVGAAGNASSSFIQGGNGMGGLITGAEMVGSQLYAISNAGGLYVVSSGELNSEGARTVGRYVATATDLRGINFTGLRAGPQTLQNGELQQILFGITASGDIHAFDTNGVLQPIFAGGQTSISTGISGAQGLDFSTLDFNLWHTSEERTTDAGHRQTPLDINNSTRPGPSGADDYSLGFNYETDVFGGLFSPQENPVVLNNNNVVQNPRQDGQTIENTINFPGGAHGVMQTNTFDLEGYSSTDQPMLYFSYFLETDGVDGTNRNGQVSDRDALRVYVVTDEGVEHLVATNNTARGGNFSDDEFDDPPQTGVYADDIDLQVQQLFDNTGTWRQARVPLGEFAGMSGLSLRVEFSTAGAVVTGSTKLRAVPANKLNEGQTFTVNGQVFEFDFAPTVVMPAGSTLAELYVDPNEVASITIEGDTFVLNDGTRTVLPGQRSIDLLAEQPAGTTLSDLSGADIAQAIANSLAIAPLQGFETNGFDFSDASDSPTVTDGTNDFIYEATPLPYTGGNVEINGTGRIGGLDSLGNPTRPDDVDLLTVDVIAGSVIDVDVRLNINPSLTAAVRFFDAAGNPLTTTSTGGVVRYTATESGTIYIGISGRGNESYDIRDPGSASPGQIDTYTASVSIATPGGVSVTGGVLELTNIGNLQVSDSSLFMVGGTQGIVGAPVQVTMGMSAAEVAEAISQAIADRFNGGNTDAVPVAGSSIQLGNHVVNDVGPLALEGDRYGDRFGVNLNDTRTIRDGVLDNEVEGVYLDDFIIGFAERGEIATGSAIVDGSFITDARPDFAQPNDETSNLNTGTYQVEIRDASEYVVSSTPNGLDKRFRTFDTNDRLSDSRSVTAMSADQLSDGQTFQIHDGRSTVTFEFDLVEADNGVQPGNVRVPFTLQQEIAGTEDIDPATGQPIPGTATTRPGTAGEVGAAIIAAINRADVQSVVNVSALPASGIDSTADPKINLYGNVEIIDDDGVFAAVEFDTRRGDSNRDRGGQGVILVENSQFLFNGQYGININHDATATVAGVTSDSIQRYPRNLIEQNTEGLVPGVVVRSNVLAYNETGGLQVTGLASGGDGTSNPPLSFERIINNTIVGGTITAGAASGAEIFDDILFDLGDTAFADVVVSYDPATGTNAPDTGFDDATRALGAPDAGATTTEPANGNFTTSLGLGGSITLQFTDNLLTGSGDSSPDLAIFEVGSIESVMVELSRDGINFIDVGMVFGDNKTLDIDAAGFGPGDRVAYVRLTDLGQGDAADASRGADIDAVGAISSVPADQFTGGGTGINLVGAVAPTLLNNLVANSDTGIASDTPAETIVLGGNAYYRNANDATGVTPGEFSLLLNDGESVFVAPSDLVFSPAANSRIIDSSIDSLEDRPSLVTVKNPIGLPPSPILAPSLDVNGQLRVDDPNVETPSGLGERVFKDRGAVDRGDLAGPRAVLVSPQAAGLGTGAGTVSVFGNAPDAFEIQLIDGLAPADVTPGTGIDDRTVSSNSLILLRDGELLTEGVDYRFGYNPSSNTIRLTPIAGVWQEESTYTVRLISGSDSLIRASAGTGYVDGSLFSLADATATATTFEYESGITVTVDSALTGADVDGMEVVVFDGVSELTLELDSNNASTGGNIRIAIESDDDSTEIAAKIAAAIDSVGLNVDAASADNVVQLLGTNPLSTVAITGALGTNSGSIGVSPGFGIQIPVNGNQPASALGDGDTFQITANGVGTVIFEFDNNGATTTAGAVPVTIPLGASLDQIADAMVRAIGGQSLGLTASNAGFGRVALSGNDNVTLSFNDSGLTQIGEPGDGASVPVVIPVDATDEQAAQRIADAINGAGLFGVTADAISGVVFVEGTAGLTGDGSVVSSTISDDVGNPLQSNQINGRTELTIFIGGGFDYGDAPAPYASSFADGGARHGVDTSFSIGTILSPDSDARLDNADDDDGVLVPSVVRNGFDASFTVDLNTDGRPFYFDAWFDWNADGVFETVERYGSVAGNGRELISDGDTITVQVPVNAVLGETYARFRLSEVDNLGSTGDAATGEVEDYRLVVSSNPFTNPSLGPDVNASGAVTPLDALQIINMLNRNGGNTIDLQPSDVLPPPAIYPDVSSDGSVSAFDALLVINYLNRMQGNNFGQGEGEAAATTAYQPVASGVMASAATVQGDLLIAENPSTESDSIPSVGIAEGEEPVTTGSTSVFDDAAVVALDDTVDLIAAANAAQDDDDDSDSALFDQVLSEF
ncbi:Dockerin type I repeat protein [Crateriforma conspicua]|nr:Dockerin type I repeat protein [Crateriforma conspicua]